MQQPGPEQQNRGTSQETSSLSCKQQLEAEQHKTEEYLDLLRRTQADFVNYKRRTEQEHAEGRAAGQTAVIERLLPVLDDLGRALTSVPPELAQHPWVQGVLLVARRLSATLEQLGVQPVGIPGEPFDPRRHEAIMTEPCATMHAGTIVRVLQPGYALGDRIIRPAQVVVAGAP